MEEAVDVTTAVTATEPIPSYRPDAKARRYDRQLRLWASAGQRSLEQTRVLLIGCDAAGCQSLKNLVLPGISHFTILSPSKTTSQDVATNFFLHPDSIGHDIAPETVKYLKELNPAVEGIARVEDPATLLKNDSSFFTSFTLIISSNTEPELELAVAELLWQTSDSGGGPDIPLISIRNSGFIGQVEIQVREHCVIDTHPDTTHTLRIDRPFSALERYARSLDMASMDSMEHSHVPYLVLLVRALCEWKDSHHEQLPTYDDREALKESLNKARRKSDEENYDEALAQAFKCWNVSEVPSEVRDLLHLDKVQNVNNESKNLHLLLHALGIYLQSHPLPPISPSLPDMHSSTASYIVLQNLYKNQYLSDLAEYRQILSSVLEKVGLPPDAVPDDEIESFAKNSGGVDIVRGTSLQSRKTNAGFTAMLFDDHLFDSDSEYQLPVSERLAILAAEQFFVSRGRWPGSSSDFSDDVTRTEELAGKIIGGKAPMSQSIKDAIAETVRGGFGSLPNTAAFIGGIVAQEAIKLVTGQYSPLNNTVVIDLIKSTTTAFKL